MQKGSVPWVVWKRRNIRLRQFFFQSRVNAKCTHDGNESHYFGTLGWNPEHQGTSSCFSLTNFTVVFLNISSEFQSLRYDVVVKYNKYRNRYTQIKLKTVNLSRLYSLSELSYCRSPRSSGSIPGQSIWDFWTESGSWIYFSSSVWVLPFCCHSTYFPY